MTNHLRTLLNALCLLLLALPFAFASCGNSLVVTGDASGITHIAGVVDFSNVSPTEIDTYGVSYGKDSEADDSRRSTNELTGNKYTVTLSGLSPNTTYYYRAYISVDGNYIYGNTKSFKTQTFSPGKGKAVDLGLSVKWASYNVGAASPEDYGDYFAWGETTTKDSYTDANSVTYGISYSTLKSKGIIDSDGNLTAAYDAATANWGKGWRMPTLAEIKELVNNCTWTWTTHNGVNGQLVTGPNGNIIFLPAAGYRFGTSLYGAGSDGNYWSSTACEDFSHDAYGLIFGSGYYYWYNDDYRGYGQSFRPVAE